MTNTEVSEVLAGWKSRPIEEQVKVLAGVVLDLLVEVEALRITHLSDSQERERYSKAYQEAGLLSYNSAGPSTGMMKMIDLYYPVRVEEGRSWREILMLRRLGQSAAEIAEFKRLAEEAEQYT